MAEVVLVPPLAGLPAAAWSCGPAVSVGGGWRFVLALSWDEPAPAARQHPGYRRRAEAILAAGEKRCPHCKRTLPLDAYRHARRYLDGRQPVCRACQGDYRRSPRGQPREGGRVLTVNLLALPLLDRAACRDADPEAFFDEAREAEALAICRGCPERVHCLDFAVRTGQRGFWGGTTEAERGLPGWLR